MNGPEESNVGPQLHSGNHTTPLLPVTDMEDTTQSPSQLPDPTNHHFEANQHAGVTEYTRPALKTSNLFDFTGHVDCTFTNVFSESKGSQSLEAVSTFMNTIYSVTQQATYIILTVFIGTFFVILWAILFGISNFLVVWMLQPVLKLTFVFLRLIGELTRVSIRSILQPLFLAVSVVYSNFNGSFNVNVAAQDLTDDTQQMV